MRGEEETLQRLQNEWPQIAVQTAWNLEPLFCYCTPNDVPCSVPTPPQQAPNSALHSSAQSSPTRQPLSVNDVHPPHSSAQSRNHIELAVIPQLGQPLSVNNMHPPQSTGPASHNVSMLQSPDPSSQEHFLGEVSSPTIKT